VTDDDDDDDYDGDDVDDGVFCLILCPMSVLTNSIQHSPC
jgi:hypothetical protein